jgi:hypothetical protein
MPIFPFNDTASIYHFIRVANNEMYDPYPAYTGVNISITPSGTDIQTSLGDVASFQIFEAFFSDITLSIKNADRIVVDSTGATYIVDGMPFVVKNRYLKFIRVLVRQVV